MKSGWWVAGALTSLRIFQHHPQKSFRLDQKYFETFIILGTGPFVYICISFVATVTLAPGTLLITCNMYLVFVHTVRKWCESAKARKLRQRCEDGKDRQRERASAWDFCVYRCHFLATEVISMAKLHSQITLDVEVFVGDGWMNAENAIRIPQQDCVQSLPELWACKFPHQYPMAYKLFIGCVCKQSIVYSVWSNDRTVCACKCAYTAVYRTIGEHTGKASDTIRNLKCQSKWNIWFCLNVFRSRIICATKINQMPSFVSLRSLRFGKCVRLCYVCVARCGVL